MESRVNAHILLVEDERVIALDQANLLEDAGYAVTSVATGEEAVSRVRSDSTIDLVLMDLQLGYGITGVEAARRINALKDVPVVFVTAYGDPKTIAEVSEVSRYGYVVKSSGPALLLQAIEMALDLFRSHQATATQRSRLEALIDASPDPILLCGMDHTLQEANSAAAELFGLDPERDRGRSLGDVADGLPPRLRDAFLSIIDGAPEAGEAPWDLTLSLPSGESRTFDVVRAPAEDERDAEAAVIIARDVTDRAATERALREKSRQLQSLSRHIEETKEEQNRYIAREIHDELGQSLTSLDISLSLLEEDMEAPESPDSQLRQTLNEMRRTVHRTSEIARRVVRELRPTVLEHFGLIEAVRSELQAFEKRTEIDTSFHLELGGEPELGDKRALALYRIVQEALTNAARHAGADRISVSLRDGESDGSVVLRISDDGRGFVPEEAGKGENYGLLGMKERALAIDASLTIDSRPGRGTAISVGLGTAKES